jgi:two-component system chemotaxis response regulator CheB
MNKAIKVLIVDDSMLVRESARKLLSAQANIHVMDTAVDAIAAWEKMQHEWPDVIVLDIQMPRMDGLSFLRKIMAERPTPVVICSSLIANGAQAGIDALAAGAVGLISKPKTDVQNFFNDESDSIVAAVRAAARSHPERLRPPARPVVAHARPNPDPVERPSSGQNAENRVIALGSSTGGTQALETVLSALPSGLPGIVLVQHMPAGFTHKLADRLNKCTGLTVREAQHKQPVEPGQALIAPAGKQMRLVRGLHVFHVEVLDGPVINRHRPSVDCLFGSVAKAAGSQAIGVLMTGMGDDGALGMKEMRDAGAYTIAEAEETCVVFGMPRAAIERGGVREVLPLHKIADKIRYWATRF